MNELFQVIRSIDLKIYHFLGLFAGNVTLNRLVKHEEANGLLKGGVFFGAYWYLWFRNGPDRERRRSAIIAILIGAVLAIGVARAVAFATPFRARPMYDPAVAHPSYALPITANLENWSAFPSDTAAYFFALAFGLAYLSRRLAVPILLYTAVWICLPRMYLGLHYTSDIIVGGVIGICVALLALQSDFLQSTVGRRALAEMESKPQRFYPIAFLVSFEMAGVFQGLRDLGRGLLHAVLVELHIGYASSPIDEWGGLLAMAGILLIAIYIVLKSYKLLQRVRIPVDKHR